MAETRYQMLEVLSFCDWERAYPRVIYKDKSADFSGGKKYNESFRGVYFFRIGEKT